MSVLFVPISKAIVLIKIKNQDLLQEAKRTKTLIVGNFCSHKSVRDVESLTFIHHNSWGEVYCYTKRGNPVASIQENLAFTNLPLPELLSKTPTFGKRLKLLTIASKIMFFQKILFTINILTIVSSINNLYLP